MPKMCELSCNLQMAFDDLMDWLDLDLETETDEEKLQLVFEPNESDIPFETELFVLVEGGEHVIELLKLVTNNKDFKKIATIPNTERGLTGSPCILFKNNRKLLALLKTDSNTSGEVNELLRPYAELAKDVAIVHIKQLLTYKGVLPPRTLAHDSTFIRGINSKLKYIEELRPPNMISGASAGIASWRSFKEQPVSSYVVFTHKFRTIESLKLLTDIGLDGLKKPLQLKDEESYVGKIPYIYD